MNTYRDLLVKFESAIRRRNPVLADRLLPGLAEARVRKMLDRGKVKGAIEPLVALYSWKNGTQPNPYISPERPSLFPGAIYMLSELDLMIAHFQGFKELSIYHARYNEVVGRYFPLFWDGSTDFIAADLEPSSQGRVIVIEKKAEKLVREAYATFDDFLKDAIHANENNKLMACFRIAKEHTTASSSQPEISGNTSTSNVRAAGTKILTTGKTLALRTDFSDESAWKSLCAVLQDPNHEFRANLDFVSHPAYDGLKADQLPSLLSENSTQTFAFIIDRVALSLSDHPILVIDLHDKPRRTFRVIASEIANVESNLAIANMGFEEFADAVGKDGVFRGFPQT